MGTLTLFLTSLLFDRDTLALYLRPPLFLTNLMFDREVRGGSVSGTVSKAGIVKASWHIK